MFACVFCVRVLPLLHHTSEPSERASETCLCVSVSLHVLCVCVSPSPGRGRAPPTTSRCVPCPSRRASPAATRPPRRSRRARTVHRGRSHKAWTSSIAPGDHLPPHTFPVLLEARRQDGLSSSYTPSTGTPKHRQAGPVDRGKSSFSRRGRLAETVTKWSMVQGSWFRVMVCGTGRNHAMVPKRSGFGGWGGG